MGDYIQISDIQNITGVIYNEESSPTLNQIETYIKSAENQFELECGVFKEQEFEDIIVDGYSFGIWLKQFIPLKELTLIEVNKGNDFEPEWETADIKHYIENPMLGKVVFSMPIIGHRVYRVSGISGYEVIPQHIKDLVILYVFRQIFQNEFFSKKGASVTETVDVRVYKEVTNGGSLSNGINDLDLLIETRKQNLQNRLKTYLL
jgi:hypothetical protein